MSFQYHDEKIPKKPMQGGGSSRSVFDAGSRRKALRSGTGRWTIVTPEELFYGSGKARQREDGRPKTEEGQEEAGRVDTDDRSRRKEDPFDRFAVFLRMTRNYQVTDEGRREAFLAQARWMESYEEEHPIANVEFYHQYVGYQEMDAWELHGYFAWRTGFRRGESVPYCFEYLRLHAAELINLIGVRSRREAFDRLLLLQAEMTSRKGTQSGERMSAEGSLHSGRGFFARRSLLDGTVRISQTDRKKISAFLAGFLIAWTAESGQSRSDGADPTESGRMQSDAVDQTESGRMQSDGADAGSAVGPAPELLQAYCISNPEREEQNITLLQYDRSDDAAVFRMIRGILPGRALSSEFLRQAGEDGWRVIARVFRQVCRRQKQAGALQLAERLLGERRTLSRELFPMTPYETHAKEGSCVEVSPATLYHFQEGRWHRSEYSILRDEGAVRELGDLVRECERVLRKKLHYRNQLPDRMKNPSLAELIASETDHWLREKALRNRPEVRVDLSRLSVIREMADVTRERLLEGTEEGLETDVLGALMNGPSPASEADEDGLHATAETEPGREPDAKAQEAGTEAVREQETGTGAAREQEAGTEAAGEREAGAGFAEEQTQEEAAGAGIAEEGAPTAFFSKREADFLRRLLEGDSGAAFFRDHKLLPSVFVDAINEKAFDEVGDVIVEEGADGWQLVEDYISEVAALLEGR